MTSINSGMVTLILFHFDQNAGISLKSSQAQRSVSIIFFPRRDSQEQELPHSTLKEILISRNPQLS